MRARPLVPALSAAFAAALVLAPAPAQAAPTGGFSGGTLTVTLHESTNLMVASYYAGGYEVTSTPDFSSLPGCSRPDAFSASWVCPGSLTSVAVTGSSQADSLDVDGPIALAADLGAGDDYVDLWVDTAEVHLGPGDDMQNTTFETGAGGITTYGGPGDDYIETGAGDDHLDGGDGHDVLNGWQGHDTLVGGAGDDKLFGDAGHGATSDDDGDDHLDGGDGDDLLTGGLGADVFVGGAGNDTASYDNAYGYMAGTKAWAVSLDTVANDGLADEGDNADADGGVENVKGPGAFNGLTTSTIIGNDGPNVLTVGDGSTVHVEGRGGDDTIEAGSFSGPATLLGGDGNDKLGGWGVPSLIDGGAGDDRLTGSDGSNDTLVGGAGRDTIDGRDGHDTIDAVDGEADTIACGDGTDAAAIDPIDGASGCETVTIVTGPPSPTTPPGPTTPAPTTPAPTTPAPTTPAPTTPAPTTPGTPGTLGKLSSKVGKSIKVSKKGVTTLKVRNGLGTSVTVKAAVKSTKPSFKAGSGKSKVAAGKVGKIKVKLSKAALKALKKKGKLKVSITFSAGRSKVVVKTTLVR